jgi:hypothetical protein
MGTRVAHARAAVPWVVVLAAAGPGLVLCAVGVMFHGSTWAASPMRIGMVLLAVPAAFLLDDPSAGVSTATPRSPWWDLGARLLGLAALCGAIVALAWGWDQLVPTPQAWLLALIPICAAGAGVAGAALLRRSGRVAPGDVVASVMGVVLLALLLFQPRWATWELLPGPGSASGAEVAGWVALGCASPLILVLVSRRGARAAVDG